MKILTDGERQLIVEALTEKASALELGILNATATVAALYAGQDGVSVDELRERLSDMNRRLSGLRLLAEMMARYPVYVETPFIIPEIA